MQQVALKHNSVPALRVRRITEGRVSNAGNYVLYWITAYRRPTFNFSLQRARDWARQLNKPLVVLEALRCDYPWASDRFHQFIVEGMADNSSHFARKRVLYHPYVEPHVGAGKGLIAELSRRACVVVSDDFPCFFLPRMIGRAARDVPVRFELVDSNGLLPMRAVDKVFLRAFDFRRFLQKTLLPHLAELPEPDPLRRIRLPQLDRLPTLIAKRWPATKFSAPVANDAFHCLPVDHAVSPVKLTGGAKAARKQLDAFLRKRLATYETDRNQPERNGTSGLSPYLHFGHISAHEIFDRLTRLVEWTPGQVASKATGSASGWWGASSPVEAFLDQMITWRELGFNMCWQRDDYDRYESLPEWAQRTLAEHEHDERKYVYSLEQFELAQTHDALWNAAQRQLVCEGSIHNYLRMLWGKKILQWTASPREALEIMIELNNKYALDGRDPNSYSGIFWVLGRYDRAWGPERPIFGKIRYMSSRNTARKVKVKNFIKRYSADRGAERG